MKHFFILLLACLWIIDASAQYRFGRNKVQYNEFDWQVLQTQHFDIYYYPEMEDLAHVGAAYAEEAFVMLQNRFEYTLHSRIPLIFYSSSFHFTETNTIDQLIPAGVGGFFEFLKGRVVIPADGDLNQFKHVIRHELVHVFTHAKYTRVMKDYREPNTRFFPLWFTEGIAEYWSGDPPDIQSQMVMRDAVISGYILPITQMYQINGSYLMYKLGESICQHIADQYGDHKLLELFDNAWKTENFSENLKLTIGKDYEELGNEWIYALKKKYYPYITHEDIPSQVSTLVTPSGFNFQPELLENPETGQKEVYYIGNKSGYTSIYKTILEPNEKGDIDNYELVIEGEKSQIYESFKAFDSGLSINADRDLLFVTRSGESDVLHIYNLDEKELSRTYRLTDIIKIGSAEWAHHSKRIVFSGLDMSGRSDLYVFTPETEELIRLTKDLYQDINPVWSPDDRFILFSSDRLSETGRDVMGIFAFDLTTFQFRSLTNDTGVNDEVSAFSNDGSYLLFTSSRSNTRNVWTMKWADIQSLLNQKQDKIPAYRLTSVITGAFDPEYTNGTLLFSAFEYFGFKVRMIEQADRLFQQPLDTVWVNTSPWLAGTEWTPPEREGAGRNKTFDYDKEYSLDIAQGALTTTPYFGTVGGITVGLSDMLGDDRYYLTVLNTAETRSEILNSFNFAVAKEVRGERTDYAYGIFHLNGRRYDFTDPDEYFYERSIGGFLSLSYPLSSFNRLESSVSLATSNKEAIGYDGFYGGTVLESGERKRKAFIFSHYVSFVYDNSLWAFTGPLDGQRFSLTLGYTTDVQYNNVNYYTIIADYRHYYRITDRTAYAVRLQTQYNDGEEARRFYMIGAWDLRGFRNFELRGRKIWQLNQELRFPLVDNFGLRLPFVDINLSMFRGALFFDAGNAWDDEYPGTVGSYGVGVRWNLAGAIVLRYDIGKKWYYSLNDQSRTFYQFFFGWDF